MTNSQKEQVDSLFNQAWDEDAADHFDEAIRLLMEAYDIDSEDADVLCNLAVAHINKKEYYSARYFSQKGLSIAPNCPYLLFNAAMSHLCYAGYSDYVESNLLHCLSLKPEYLDNPFLIEVVPPDALKRLRSKIQKSKSNGAIWMLGLAVLGASLGKMGQQNYTSSIRKINENQ